MRPALFTLYISRPGIKLFKSRFIWIPGLKQTWNWEAECQVYFKKSPIFPFHFLTVMIWRRSGMKWRILIMMSYSVFTVFVIDFDGTSDKFDHVAIISDQQLEVWLFGWSTVCSFCKWCYQIPTHLDWGSVTWIKVILILHYDKFHFSHFQEISPAIFLFVCRHFVKISWITELLTVWIWHYFGFWWFEQVSEWFNKQNT